MEGKEKEIHGENIKKTDVLCLPGGKGWKQFRRASSCDTSKGIDDIEDFEVDGLEDFDLPLEENLVDKDANYKSL